MHLWIITFFLGISTLLLCTELPSLYWLLILPSMLFIQIFPIRNSLIIQVKARCCRDLFTGGSRILTHILIFSVGFCWALVYTHWITSWSLPSELEGKKVLVTGYIASLPIAKPHHISFEFKTDNIADTKIATKLRLSWYGQYSERLHAGDKWQLLVRLKRPHGTLNPGGFDLEKHLLVHHIRATGYVVADDFNKILSSHWYNCTLMRLRQYLIANMQAALYSDELTPIIIALVTGSENEITQQQWEVMRNTGTSYLVAISGLHIGLVASIVLVLVQFLWRRSKHLPLIMPAREAGVVAGLFVGFVYGAVSGFSIPTQRALVMLIMFSLAALLRRNTQVWNAWLWSLFLVLIIDPLAPLTIGFWLSFMAVAAILYASSWRLGQATTHLSKFWRMQLIVTIALLPLTLLFFQQFSLTTLVANMLAMPGVCLVVVPLSLLGALCLSFSNCFGGWILWLSAKLLYIVWWWLALVANFSWSSWYHPIYNWWILIAASVGVLLLFAPRGFPVRCLGVVWLLPLFFYTPAKPKPGEVWFTLLDVGQGLSAVVQTANHLLLYDTGPKFLEHDVGMTTVIPYLRLQGAKIIDVMVVSHGDADHSGGAESILKALPVNTILTSVPAKFYPRVAQACVAGQHWQWDGVDFQVLSPPSNAALSGNEASCVVKITQGAKSILLTGDIEHDGEDLLVKNYGANLKSTVLVAPHHGSATSSTQTLIDFVQPKYTLFPIGYKNRFHFPHKKIIARYTASGARLLNTAQEGAITFKFDDKSDILAPTSYREKEQYFWNYK